MKFRRWSQFNRWNFNRNNRIVTISNNDRNSLEIKFILYFFTSLGIFIFAKWTYSVNWPSRLMYINLLENFALQSRESLGLSLRFDEWIYLINERSIGQRNLIHVVGWTIYKAFKFFLYLSELSPILFCIESLSMNPTFVRDFYKRPITSRRMVY